MAEAIKIQPIDPKEAKEVVDFFHVDFFNSEPMCKALGGIDESPAFDMWLERTATSGMSFEAIDTANGNRRVGAYLCTSYKNGVQNAIDAELEAFESVDEKMSKIGAMLDKLHAELRPKIFQQFGINEYLEGVNLSVLPSYAGMGIAGKLTQAIEDRARELNIPLVYACCSSEYTARVVQKRDYQLIHTWPYKDYTVNGEVVFAGMEEPHMALKCYVKRVME